MSVNGTLVEDKMRRFKGECAHFMYLHYNKCPIYTYDGASVQFTTKSHETDNSVGVNLNDVVFGIIRFCFPELTTLTFNSSWNI